MYLLYQFLTIFTTKEATEVTIPIAENHNVVLLPIAEFLVLTLFGSTYIISFCCR